MGKTPGKPDETSAVTAAALENAQDGEIINVSGHKQEVDRIFDPLSCISLAVAAGNVWPALAGSITIAIYNGGPPGMIYEFIAASVFYWFVAASIAELASAIPSAGGVYHWATVTGGPKHGKICGYFAGYWNFFAWLVATASVIQICANILVAMYAVTHRGLVAERWMVFVAYLILCWLSAAIVLFANKVTPYLQQFAALVVIVGLFVTMIVCAVMPHVNGTPYASNSFVWSDWVNLTGYSSNGMAFLLGMLNGSFAVGPADVTSHLAEEIPRPQYNIPKAMLWQYVIGFISGLLFLIPVMYGINDLEAIQSSTLLFPLADIYRQVTGSAAGSIGLLLLVFIPIGLGSIIGCYLTVSRIWWTLARDKATPFSRFFGTIHPRTRVPANAIVLIAISCTVLGCIYIGNATAFSAFASSFIVLNMAAYSAAILPHLLSKRSRIQPGPFWMKGAIGYVTNIVSCAFMLAFTVIFCFPFAMPVDEVYMNYTCVLLGGFTIICGVFYLFLRKTYEGPKIIQLEGGAAEITVEELRAKGTASEKA